MIPFKNKDRKPVVEGQRVLVITESEGVHEGDVVSVLDTQFTYRSDDDGLVRYCNYDGDWRDNEPR